VTLLDVVMWVRRLRGLRRVGKVLARARLLDAERDAVTGAFHDYEAAVTYLLGREDPALIAQAEAICDSDALELTAAPESDAHFLRALHIRH
jgi:hypothetical protein